MSEKKSKSSIITYKIDMQKEMKLRDAVRAQEIDEFEKELEPVEANYHTTNLLKKILSKLEKHERIEWGKKFVDRERNILRVVGIILLQKMKIWRKDVTYTHNLLDICCRDEDWNVRQITVDILSEMLSKREGDGKKFFLACIKADKDPFRRRLALLTAKKIAQSSYFDDELKKEVLEDIKPLLVEHDPYVITITTETFNEGFMKYCTDMTLKWINENLGKIEEPEAKSIILRMIGTKYVEERIEDALDIMDKFLEDNNPQVKKARSAALHNLSEHFEHTISSYLEDRMHIKQAVDHWADLVTIGNLNSIDF